VSVIGPSAAHSGLLILVRISSREMAEPVPATNRANSKALSRKREPLSYLRLRRSFSPKASNPEPRSIEVMGSGTAIRFVALVRLAAPLLA
jgi:hypothetical protein